MLEQEWMLIAKKELGVKEIPGSKHNKRIIEYHSKTTLKASQDEVPWCSSFVCWVMDKAGYKTTQSAAAKSWLKYGQRVKPRPGAIMVFDRGSNPAFGHVAFYVKETENYYYCLGGNQNNTVCIARYHKSKFKDARWPRVEDGRLDD